MEAFEYAIKKDVRNNPIVREVDEARQRELWKSVGRRRLSRASSCSFSAWQHFELLRHGYQVEELQRRARRARKKLDRQSAPRDRHAEVAASGSRRWPPDSCISSRPSTRRGDRHRACACRPSRRPRPSSPGGRTTSERCPAYRAATSRLGVAIATALVVSDRLAVLALVGRRDRSARSSTCRCSDRADLVGARRATAEQHAADRRRSAATSSIAAAASWRRASTPTRSTRSRPKSTIARRRGRRSCASALDDCYAKERQALAERLGQKRAFAYVRRQVSPDQAQRVAALNLDGVGFIKESRRFYPNKELAAHLLGYVGIDNTGLERSRAHLRLADPRQGRARCSCTPTRGGMRSADSSGRRRPARRIELTIDEYLQHIAERELHAGVLAQPRRRRERRSS